MADTPARDDAPRGSERNSYRSILKGTSIFGGVQLFHILVSLVRGKLVAMFLGPGGMGVSALYVSSTAAVQKFASLGLNLAIVKEVGASADSDSTLATVVRVARRLTLMTGLLGALVCMLASHWLSEGSFGDTSHTTGYIALAAMVFFSIAGGGEMAILQGRRQVRRLSHATVVGSVCGLVVSVPLYWLYGVDGIVPAMIALAFAVWLFYRISGRGDKQPGVGESFAWRRHWPLVRHLLGLGILLMASDMMGTVCTYLLQVYVRWCGGLADLGIFQGANSLTIQYAGVVFAAMSMDYLPRLSREASDNVAMGRLVNRQIEVVSCLIGPLAGALVIAAPWVVDLLLTPEFLPAVPLLRWLGLALLLQALMFPMAYVTFAKDNRRVYFWIEVIGGNVMILLFSAVGYRWFGLLGLGIGSVVDKAFWLVMCCLVNYRLYGCRPDTAALRHGCVALFGGGALFAVSMWGAGWWSWIVMGALWLGLAGYSLSTVRVLLGEKRYRKSRGLNTDENISESTGETDGKGGEV